MDESTTVTTWSRIRRIVGPTGTYCFGSADKILDDQDWTTRFYREAAGFGFTVRVEQGQVYLDARP